MKLVLQHVHHFFVVSTDRNAYIVLFISYLDVNFVLLLQLCQLALLMSHDDAHDLIRDCKVHLDLVLQLLQGVFEYRVEVRLADTQVVHLA